MQDEKIGALPGDAPSAWVFPNVSAQCSLSRSPGGCALKQIDVHQLQAAHWEETAPRAGLGGGGAGQAWEGFPGVLAALRGMDGPLACEVWLNPR